MTYFNTLSNISKNVKIVFCGVVICLILCTNIYSANIFHETEVGVVCMNVIEENSEDFTSAQIVQKQKLVSSTLTEKFKYYKNSYDFKQEGLMALLSNSGTVAQNQKVVASDRLTNGANFGVSVSIDGSYAVVGAWAEPFDENGQNELFRSGAAYVFERDGNGTWTEVKKLVSQNREEEGRFGFSVSISGNYIAVGEQQEDFDENGQNEMTSAGAIWIFERTGGTWTFKQKLVASDRATSDILGKDVWISGNYVIGGAVNQDFDENGQNEIGSAGAAYIFERNGSGTWVETAKLVAPDRLTSNSNDRLGESVAMTSNYAVVGSFQHDFDENGQNEIASSGAAYIYENDFNGNWNFVQKITQPAAERGTSENFGNEVAIDGSTIVVGVRNEDEDENNANTVGNAGAVYVFDRAGNGTWSQTQKLVSSDRTNSDNFGNSVSISGNCMIVGAWQEDHDANGNNLLNNAGSSYIFNRSGGTWTETQKIVSSDREGSDNFGRSVSVSGQIIIVGVNGDDDDENDMNTISGAGSAYFFSPNTLVGEALDFDGVDDYVNLGNENIIGTSDFTIETWIYFRRADIREIFIGKESPGDANDQFRFMKFTDNTLHFYIDDDGFGGTNQNAVTTTTLNTNVWTHLAAVRSGTNLKIYINGTLEADATDPVVHSMTATYPLNIGARNNGTDPTDALIDEVRIWNRALCELELQTQMNCELGGNETGLIAYYQFNQGTAGENNSGETTLNDATSNNHDGTLTGFTLNGPNSNWVAPGSGVSGSCGSSSCCDIAITGVAVTDEVCAGGNDGTVSITATCGFCTSIEYSLDGTNFQAGNTFNNVAPGTYNDITVRDSGNSSCNATTTATVAASSAPAGPQILVNSTADNLTAGDGFCTLREAIMNANLDTDVTGGDCACGQGNDQITFDASINTTAITLTLTGTGEDAGATGDLDIAGTNTLTINGNGPNNTIIDGNDIDRVFDINGTGTVTIQNLTIQNGRVTGTDNGGGIFMDVTGGGLALNTVSITDCEADDGGGISIRGSGNTLQMDFCRIENCAVLDNGGGIFNTGANTVDINDCLISSNTGVDLGGGVMMSVDGGTITFRRTCIRDNQGGSGTNAEGGGVYMADGNYRFFNCTISGNNCYDGAGLMDDRSDNDLLIINCTIVDNTAINEGGGILCGNNSGTNRLKYSIVANNTAGQTDDLFIFNGGLTENESNLVESCGSTTTCPSFTVQADPNLAPMTECGSLCYFPLYCGSPAIDVPATGSALSEDICGNSRDALPNIGSSEVVLDGGNGCAAAEALSFDGTDDYIHLGTDLFDTETGGTIEAWVRFSSVNSEQHILSSGSRTNNGEFFIFGIQPDATLFVGVRTPQAGVNSTTTLSTGTWYHVAATSDGSEYKLYINGIEEVVVPFAAGNTGAWFNEAHDGINDYSIGALNRANGIEDYLDGQLDEVRVWNRVLCQQEIITNMGCEISASPADLLFYAQFNQGFNGANNASETVLNDIALGNNDGSLQNFTLTGNTSNWIAPGGTISGNCSPVNCCDMSISDVAVTDETCPDDNDGTVTITATCNSCTNGDSDLEYTLGGGTGFQSSNVFNNVAPGNYTVGIRDANFPSCQATQAITVAVGVDNAAPSFGQTEDQSQNVSNFNYTGSARTGQSFTAGITGTLDRVDLRLRHSVGSDLTIRIREGNNIAGVILTSEPLLGVTTSYVTYEINFSQPIQVVAGQEYTIEARDDGAAGDVTIRSQDTDVYAGGHLWLNSTAYVNRDARFITYVSQSCENNDQTVSADGSCNGVLGDYTGLVTATDNCTTPTVTQSPVSGTSISTATVVTLTADDGNGNTSSCSFDVSIVDNTNPTAVCQDDAVILDGSFNGSISTSDINNGSSDNCTAANDLTLSLDLSSFDCSHLGPNTVTLTVTDEAGNSATCTANVDVAHLNDLVFTVNDSGDGADANPGDCLCADASGNCTFRAAIEESNASGVSGRNVDINFSVATVDIAAQLPTLNIGGVNAGNLTVYTIAGLAGGTVVQAAGGYTGGLGIQEAGQSHTQLDLSLLRITGFETTANGAALRFDGETNFLNVNGCVFDNNTANRGSSYWGGDATVTFTNCTFRDNTDNLASQQGTFGDKGDGVYTFTNCTFHGNNGAIWVHNGPSTVNVINCTIINNSVFGIRSQSSAGQETFHLTNNIIYNNGTDIEFQLSNNVVATNNTNIVGTCTGTGCPGSFFSNADPNLAAFQLCTGQRYFEPQAGSAALDAGTIAGAPTTDICGNARTGGSLDIGSYESGNAACNISITDVTVTHEGCPGASDGTVTITATCTSCTNGNSDIEYTLGGGTGFQDGNTFTGVAAGTYNVGVRDKNDTNCQATQSVTINAGTDTTPPTAVCQDVTVELAGNGMGTTTPGAVNNGSSDNCDSNVSGTLSQTSFDCDDLDGAGNAYALDFDGTDDYVLTSIQSEMNGNQALTVEAWINPENYGSGQRRLVNQHGHNSHTGWSFRILDSDDLEFVVANGSNPSASTSTNSIATGTWTHVAVVFDGTQSNNANKVEFYINGVEVANGNKSVDGGFHSSLPNHITPVVLGAKSNDFGANYPGIMDDVRIWTRALSGAEIAANYQTQLSGSESDLLLYFPLNDGTGSNTAADATSNGNNGTLNNFDTAADWVTDVPFSSGTQVTLTVEDDAGNTATCTATVNVVDNLSPMITCPANQTPDFNASCEYDLIDYTGMATGVDDNCGTPTVTQSPVVGTTITEAQTVTLTATDGSNNTTTCTFDVLPTNNVKTFEGYTNANWVEASNWCTSGAPGSCGANGYHIDEAFIIDANVNMNSFSPGCSSTDFRTSEDITINSNGLWNINSASFTYMAPQNSNWLIDGTVNMTGVSHVDNSNMTVTVNGILTTNQNFNAYNGTTITISNTGSFSGQVADLVSGTSLTNNGDFTAPGTMSWNDGGSVVNNGTMTFNGVNNLPTTANFTNNGIVKGTGTLVSNGGASNIAGTVQPGNSTGILQTSGNIEFSGNVDIEVTGRGDGVCSGSAGVAGTDFDQISSTNNSDITVSGTVDFDFTGATGLTNGDRYTIFNTGGAVNFTGSVGTVTGTTMTVSHIGDGVFEISDGSPLTHLFTGAIDDDFEVDGNWCPTGAPGTGSPITANKEVIIDADCNHIGPDGGAITFNQGITINSGNSFYTQGTGTSYLYIENKFQNDGTFEAERWQKLLRASVGTAINNGYFDVWGHGFQIQCDFENNGTIDYGEGSFARNGTPSLDNTNGIITGSNFSGGLSWAGEAVGGIIQPGDFAGEAGTFRLYAEVDFSGTVNIDVLGRGTVLCGGGSGTAGTTYDRIQPFNNTDVTISGTIDFNFPSQPTNGDTYAIITTTGTVSITGSITTSGAGGSGVTMTHTGDGVFEVTNGGLPFDTTDPTASCQGYTAQIDGGGNASVTAGDIDNNSSDNCGTVSLSISAGTTSYTCADVGEDFVVTLLVDDGNGNNATCNATVSVADGSGNCAGAQALDFDGVDDYIEVPDHASLNFGPSDAYTLETWFYKDAENSATTATHFMHKGVPGGDQNYVLGIAGSNNADANKVFFTTGSTINIGTTVAALDTWHHVAVTYDNGSYVLYLNGNVESSGTVTGGSTDNGAMRIAWSAHGTDAARNRSIDGKLDEMRIWSRALCQLEIQGYMNCALEGNEADLVAYYDFNQGFAGANNAGENTLVDQTGVNDGTLVNFALDGASSNWVSPGASISGSCDAVACCDITVDGVAVTHEVCPDAGDGTITVTATCNSCANASDIRYSIDGTNFQTSNVFNNVADGTYTATVRDVNDEGCNASDAGNVINAGTDSTNPTASCEDATIELGSGGTASITASDLANDHAAASTDNCSTILSFSSDVTSVSCSDIGTPVTVTVTVTDEASNSANCTFEATVVDNIDPTITCPGDVSVGTDSGVCTGIATFADATGTDNCTVTISQGEGPASGSAFDLGTTSVGYTATDSGGNTATCSFTVTVSDDDGPTAECQDVTLTLDGAGTATLTTAQVNNGSSDNCSAAGDLTLSLDQTSFSCSDAGGGSQNDFALDFDGSNDVVSVPDNNVFDFPSSSTFTLEAWINPDAVGGEHCIIDKWTTGHGLNYRFSIFQSKLMFLGNGPSFSVGTISTGTWQHVAVTYNNASITFYINGTSSGTFTRSAGPTNTVPLTIGNQGDNLRDFNGKIDEVRIWSITRTQADIQNDMNNMLNGNESGLIAYYPMEDGTGSSQLTDESGNGHDGTLMNMNVSNDWVSGADPLGGGAGNTVTLTVTDEANNSSTCEATITVQDTTDPTITCPDDVSVNTDTDACTASGVDLGTPTTDDNCDGETTSNDGLAAYLVGNTTVTWTVTDASGNTATCTQIVTVSDNQNPTITCPGAVEVSADNNSCAATGVELGTASSSDNCTGESISNDVPASFPVGVTTVTYTVTDASSNTASCTQTVTVTDDQLPAITCPGNMTANTDPDECTANVTYTAPTGTDNCPGAVTTQVAGLGSGGDFEVGENTETYTVTDASGNQASCSFTITVSDNEDPTVTCRNIDAELTASDDVIVNPADLVTTSGDNCTNVTLSIDGGSVTYECSDLGAQFTITVTATDDSGNTATCDAIVTVTDPNEHCCDISIDDTTVVVPSCPGNDDGSITVTATCSLCTSIEYSIDGGAFGSSNSFSGLAAGDYDIAVRDSGNHGCTTSQTVTVGAGVDTTDPVITCPGAQTVSADASCAGGVPDLTGLASATDNCSEAGNINITQDIASGTALTLNTATTVTLTATDEGTNTHTCTVDVTLIDDTAPDISCPADVPMNTGPDFCSASVFLTPPTATDNCSSTFTITANGGSVFIQNPFPGFYFGQFPVGTTTVTWTVTDENGQSTTCTNDVIITDDSAPTFTNCPTNDLTGISDAENCGTNVTWSAIFFQDNCGTQTTLTFTHDSGDFFPVGTTTVTYTATDPSGNSTDCMFDVIVTDDTPPVVSCQDIEVFLDGDGAASIVVADVVTGVTDNCTVDIANVSLDISSFDCSQAGTAVTVTASVNDLNGVSGSCTAEVTVTDNTDPSAVCQDVTVSLDASGMGSVDATDLDDGSDDNCPNHTIAITDGQTSYDCTDAGQSYTLTLTVTDASNNTATCTSTVSVVDDTNPTITCPIDVSVGTDAGECTAVVTFTDPAGADNCSGHTVEQGEGMASGSAFPTGVNTVGYTVTDASGNTATCSFTITVSDDEDPAIADCPSDITQDNDEDACNAVVNWTAPTASDNCGVDSFTSTHDSGDTFDVGTATVTYTAMDEAGNSSTCSFTVTVNDTQSPEITCPADIAIGTDDNVCTAVVSYTAPVGTDNCAGQTTELVAGGADGSTFDLGETTVTYSVTDAAGNETSCSFTVTVSDDENPVITVCPDDATINMDAGVCEGTVTDLVALSTATDNCTASVTITQSPTAGSTFGAAHGDTQTVTITATDEAGNSSTCDVVLTLNDNQDPTITACPADIVQATDADVCTAVVNWTAPTGADNCAGTVGSSHDSGDTFDLGTTAVTYSVTDAAGNQVSCSFNVTINDEQDPAITCPADISVGTDDNVCTAVVTYTAPEGTDNCTGATTELAAGGASGSTFDIGATTVTYTVTDAAGNEASCSFTVTVSDDENPTIAGCPSNISQNNDAGNCSAAVSWTAPTADDNCGVASFTSTSQIGDTFDVGDTDVTYTAVDEAGNEHTCTFTITVVDAEDPQITCPANITVNNDAGVCGAEVTYTPPVGTDNCEGSVTSLDEGQESGTVFAVGTTNVSYSVVDAAGNSASCSFTVTVNDNENPTIADCPSDITQDNDDTFCGANVSWTAPTADDNCNVASFPSTSNIGDFFPVGDTEVTYTATDDAGNTAQCSFTITVVDAEAPQITCPANITQNNDTGECSAVVTWTAPVGTDNCPGAVTELQTTDYPIGATFPLGSTDVTYSVADAAGNETSCTFSVTIVDAENPVAICQDITVELDAAGEGSIEASDVNNNSTDNCNIASMSVDPRIFDCSHVGANTVTLTVVDDAGNEHTCDATVTIEDNVAPIAICQDITIQLDEAGAVSIEAADVDNNSNDACGIDGLAIDISSFDCSNLGANTVTLTVTDNNSNESTCTSTVTVEDTVAPVINDCPENISVDAIATSCAASASWTEPTYSDNCVDYSVSLDTEGVPTIDLGTVVFGTFPGGETTISYTVTDPQGNESICSFTVTVVDNVGPVLTGCPDDIVVDNTSGECSGQAFWTAPIPSDNCTGFTLSASHNSGESFEVGSTTVTYTATDANDNESTCTFTVTVNDTEAPTVDCPETVEADAAGDCGYQIPDLSGLVTSSDNCEGDVTVTQSPAAGSPTPGATSVTVTVSDGTNSTDCNVSITVPEDLSLSTTSTDASCDDSSDGSATVTISGGTAPYTISWSSGGDSETESGLSVGDHTVDVTDANGCTASATVTIGSNDTTPPTLFCDDHTVLLDANGEASITINDVAIVMEDNCGLASMSISQDNFTCANIGANTVTVTVTDAAGLTSTCDATVTVEDNMVSTPPFCGSTIDLQLGSDGLVSIGAGNFDPVMDNCGTALDILILGQSTFTCGFSGLSLVVPVAVLDESENFSICTVTVNISDAIAPTAVCENTTVSLGSDGTASIGASDVDGGSDDNCGIESSIVTPSSFDCGDLGANTVTLVVTDEGGLTASCTATVTVVDDSAPTPLYCDDQVSLVLDASGSASLTTANFDSAVDNCTSSPTISILGQSSFDCSDAGNTIVVAVSATDAQSNVAQCNINVSVVDNTDPVALCQDASVVADGNGIATVDASAINNASFDNCSIASMTATPNTFSCSGDSDNVVTLTVTDPSGNTATCTATVTVTGGGGAGLQANCQDVTVSLDASGNASITAADVDNGSFGCGVSLSVSPSSFTCANAGNNQVTLTATESGGGTATCTAMVMVVDDINPVASCQDISVTLDAGTGMAVIVGGDVNDGSTDNCGVDVMNVSPSVFTCEDGGDNTVTLTVTDAAGNSSTCAARVSVGYAAPTAMCQASAVTVGLGTDGTATVDPAVIDNGSSGMCDDLTMSVLPATFDCADAGSNPITLIVTDGLGQTASCTATVNIIDNSIPMPDFCGGSVNIALDADGSVNIEESGFGTHLDNCGSTPLVIISLGQINFTCDDIGTNTDLLVALIDGAGNLVTCFTDVVVTDPEGHCGSGLMVNEDLLNGVQTAKAEKPQIEVWQPELDENQNSLELRGLTNTPNPFSYQTKISYRLTAPAEVQMWVMDESGRMVTMLTRGAKAAGEHNVFWQPGANVAHGVYFLMVRLDNGHIAHLKMHYTNN